MKHPKNNFINTPGYQIINNWLAANNREPFAYQIQAWEQISAGKSGLVNAPTGYGKTFSVFLGALIHFINENPNHFKAKQNNGLQLLWITPLRALAKDICRAMQQVIQELEMQWQIGIRNGDTEINIRKKQNAKMPEVLIITPESLHLLLAQKDYPTQFSQLKIIAVDEWHELLGSKRGVQVELAISRLVNLKPPKPDTGRISIWGLSATIGNLEEAKEILLSPLKKVGIIIKADFQKKIEIQSILPDEIETYPWAGHLGLKLSKKIIPIILKNDSTLIFINTRGMSEAWYQQLLTIEPELAGTMALHHGSIEKYLRTWIEESIQQGRLKAVVCTSSLDLGVDFRPVQAVVQVGSPKGVARFLQRAGRSGHQPGQTSKIYFLPTHSLELLEAAALKKAIDSSFIESRQPLTLCFDVLLQYLTTLAISEGFNATQIFKEIKSTYCYKYLLKSEWTQLLHFLTKGGVALKNYDDYKKVVKVKKVYKINNRTTAMRHRLHIGTIVSDALIKVKFINGEFIGLIEEWFISRLNPGEAFTFAGRNLEFIKLKDLVALVKVSNSTKTIIPSWMGGRLPLSANLGHLLRQTLHDAAIKTPNIHTEKEISILQPLLNLQKELSAVPLHNQLLIEHIETKDGYHVFVYPFEGRLVHEAMAALLAYRISRIKPITFSYAMNDYGFELLSDQPIPLDKKNVYQLFSEDNLFADIQQSVNASEMARRKFRDIAVIGGLIFQGMPGTQIKQKHLQSSASLLYNVFKTYEPENLLLKQAISEVMSQQMDEPRLRNMLQRIQQSKIIIKKPEKLTPFSFPIKIDSMRENISSEKLEDRIKKMQEQLNKK